MAGSPRCCYLQQAKFAPIKSALAFTSLIISLPNVVVNATVANSELFLGNKASPYTVELPIYLLRTMLFNQ